MDDVYINILARIAAELPDLWLDEDYGQLEFTDTDDSYPVTFPCALIGAADTDWEELTGDAQRGRASVTVRLAVDCYHDSHYSSGTYEAVRQRHQLAARLHKALRHFKPAVNATAMVRTRQSESTRPGGIKVIDFTFAFRLSYRNN